MNIYRLTVICSDGMKLTMDVQPSYSKEPAGIMVPLCGMYNL